MDQVKSLLLIKHLLKKKKSDPKYFTIVAEGLTMQMYKIKRIIHKSQDKKKA